MSEADAEDGLHGLDELLAIINDTSLNIEFVFFPDCFFLRRSPTEPRFRPFNFKKIPPAKKKKHGKAEWGEGGAPSQRGAGRIVRVTTQSERTYWSKATTHAERAISQSFVGKRFAQRI